MRKEELRYISNCLESKDKEKDWRLACAEKTGHFPVPEESSFIPLAWNWHRPWWNIKDQGATGACVGFAVGDSLLRWYFVQTGDIEENQHISVRYLWMASKETDEYTERPTAFIEKRGTSIKAALAIAYKYGVVLEEDLPFDTVRLYSDEESIFYATAAKRRIYSYFNLTGDVDSWKRWIYMNGPIVVKLDIDQSWLNLVPGMEGSTEWQRQEAKLAIYQGNAQVGCHACALVGYREDDYFIVRNSWGECWGNEGFAYASKEYAKAAFTEAYGIAGPKSLK